MTLASKGSGVRLAELIAALSIATDIGLGQPMEFALSSCIVAVRLAKKCGYSEEALREVYYQALLRFIGCNAETDWLSSIAGDEQILRADFHQIDTGDMDVVINMFTNAIRKSFVGESSEVIENAVKRGMDGFPRIPQMFVGHCEVAQRLAQRLGFEKNVIYGLGQLYERWDGHGLPRHIQGEAIAPAVLIVTLAQDMVLFYRLGGLSGSLKIARERKGGAYSPAIVDIFCEHAKEICGGLDQEPSWSDILNLEPGSQHTLTEDEFDNACRVLADFVDIKSIYTLTHSIGIADLSAEAARLGGLPDSDVKTLWRAALVKEIGRTGITSSIWEKPGSLTEREWERVRLHTYYAERIFARTPALSNLGMLASLHHERMDGSGYHRGLPASNQSNMARILQAADIYHSSTEARSYRPALTADLAANELYKQVQAGKLDNETVNLVLSAAGHKVRKTRKKMAGGLTKREVDVLRLLSQGLTIKEMAAELVISEKTVDSHIQHIYTKANVSTRVAATLFAMEHQLLDSSE